MAQGVNLQQAIVLKVTPDGVVVETMDGATKTVKNGLGARVPISALVMIATVNGRSEIVSRPR